MFILTFMFIKEMIVQELASFNLDSLLHIFE